MSDIKDVRCKPKLHQPGISWGMAATLRDVIFVVVGAIHAGSHVDHETRVAWFSISTHACASLL